MKWWGRLLAAEAACLLVLVILSIAPGIELPVAVTVLFLLPGFAAIPPLMLMVDAKEQLWRGFVAVPPVWRLVLIMLAVVALIGGLSMVPRGFPSYENGQYVTNNHGHKTIYTATEYAEAMASIPRLVAAVAVAFLAVMAMLCLASLNLGPPPRPPAPPPAEPRVKLWRDFDNSTPED
ncbi:hypothetical protein [Kutzneria sp. NPDC051319]|uniref:hypothetical protein n=1 Tax=Kutzneria sp. NPDC051319 TaxID=3155047 RepID=UPI003439EE27